MNTVSEVNIGGWIKNVNTKQVEIKFDNHKKVKWITGDEVATVSVQ